MGFEGFKSAAGNNNEKQKPRRLGSLPTALAGAAALVAVGVHAESAHGQTTPERSVVSDTHEQQNEAAEHREFLKGVLSSHEVSGDVMRAWDGWGIARDLAYVTGAIEMLDKKQNELRDKLVDLSGSTGTDRNSRIADIRDAIGDIEELVEATQALARTSGDAALKSIDVSSLGVDFTLVSALAPDLAQAEGGEENVRADTETALETKTPTLQGLPSLEQLQEISKRLEENQQILKGTYDRLHKSLDALRTGLSKE